MAVSPLYGSGCGSSCTAMEACLLCSQANIFQCFEETMTHCCGCRNSSCTACTSPSSCLDDPTSPSGFVCKGKFEINLAEILVLAATGLVIVGGITLCVFLLYRRRKRQAMPDAIVVSSNSGYGSMPPSSGDDPYSNYDTPPKTFYSSGSGHSASTYDVKRQSKGYERI